MRFFVAATACLVLALPGCAKRICASPTPFSSLDGIDSDFPADLLANVNNAVNECRQAAAERQIQSCNARTSEDNTRIATNVASGVFGTTAAATGGLPALVTDNGPSDAQAKLSVASGVVSLGIVLYTSVFSDKTKNEAIYMDAKNTWDAYHLNVIPARDALVKARFEFISARRQLKELEKTFQNAPPTTDTDKKALADAKANTESAWKDCAAKYLALLQQASSCSPSANKVAAQPPKDTLKQWRELMGIPPGPETAAAPEHRSDSTLSRLLTEMHWHQN